MKQVKNSLNLYALFMTIFVSSFLDSSAEPLLIDANDCIQTEYCYDKADSFINGLARVQRNGKWGFIDKKGKEVVPCVWDDIYYFNDGLALVEIDEKCGFININSELIVPCIYALALGFCDGHGVGAICEYTENGDGNWAIINNQGTPLTPFMFRDVLRDGYGNTWVFYDEEDEDGMISEVSYVIDRNGNRIDDPYKDDNETKNYRFETIYKNRKFGIATSTGEEIVPCIYEAVLLFSEGLAAVKSENKWGYVNEQGTIVIPCIYDEAKSFKDGIAIVSQNGKKGYINTLGELLLPCIYEEADYFMDGWANVNNNCFINLNGEQVLSYKTNNQIEPPGAANEKYVLDVVSGEWVAVTNTNNTTSKQSDPYTQLDSDIVFTKRVQGNDGKYGFINSINGKEVIIACIYDKASDFAERYAKVKLNGKWGFIDVYGKIVVPIEYDEAEDYYMGFASVKLNNKSYIVDLNGQRLQFSATDLRGNHVELSQPDYNLIRSIELFRDKDKRYAHPLEDKKDIVVKVEISVGTDCKMTNCKVTTTSGWVEDAALKLINDYNEYVWQEHIGSTRMYKGWPFTIEINSNNQQVNIPYKMVFPLTLRSSYFYDVIKKQY